MGGIFSSDNTSGSPGSTGPIGPTGPKGETILNLNQVLADPALTKKLLDVFVTDVRFKGVTGPAGTQGSQGSQGERGPVGIQGSQGERGPTGLQGSQGSQGPTGPRGEFTQILGSNIDDTALAIFKNALVNDTQKRFIGPTGATGAQGPSGTITNMNDLVAQLKTNSSDGTNWVSTLTNGAFASKDDVVDLGTRFNNLNTNVETNYVQKSTANSDWWLKQLSGTYVNYINENDPIKTSAYVWNNFYKKNESDGKYANKSDLPNMSLYSTTSVSDGKYANKSDLPNMSLYSTTLVSDGKYANKSDLPNISLYSTTLVSDDKYANKSELPNMSLYSTTSVNDGKYAPLKNPIILGNDTFNVGNVQKNPSLEIFSNSQTSKDFIIENTLPGESGYDILFNPRYNGKVKIGYNPYFDLDPGPNDTRDTNIPTSKLAVKGDINASENLIGKGLKIGKWNIQENSNGGICFTKNDNNINISKCFGVEEVIRTDAGASSNVVSRDGQLLYKIINPAWKLGFDSSSPYVFKEVHNKNPSQKFNINIWINLNDYTFKNVVMKFVGHRSYLDIFCTTAPFSTQNVLSQMSTHRFPPENISNPNVNIRDVKLDLINMPTKFICINVRDDNKCCGQDADFYGYIKLEKLYLEN